MCPLRVGKCKSSKHSSTEGAEESAVPIVGFDYAFLSDRDSKVSEEDDDTETVSSSVLKVLIAHDRKPKTCAARPVPNTQLLTGARFTHHALRTIA